MLSLRLGRFPVLALLLALGALPSSSEGQSQTYVETVRFSVRISETTYAGPVGKIYLMLDRYGGRNRLQDSREMTNTSGDTWETSVSLEEGDYIYVFVANPDQYVDLSDPDLNPDDVPDSNFFNDPHPRFPGFGGQFSTDNLWFVRNPNRPRFDSDTSTPKAGALITEAAPTLSVRIERGEDQQPIDPASVRVAIEGNEPFGIRPGPTEPPPVELIEVDNVTVNTDSSGATINATLDAPPEGLHLLHVDIANVDGLEADTLVLPLYTNRNNEAPVAIAGATRFTVVGRWVELDGGLSEDPDGIGFSGFEWRRVSGPGDIELRSISQEPDNNDPSQRGADGTPVIDGDGNIVGDPLAAMGALPQARFAGAGEHRMGLRVTDEGGLTSDEAFTTVYVGGYYDPNLRVRLHVGERDGRPIVSARASDLPPGTPIRFIADALTPVDLTPVPDSAGFAVELSNGMTGQSYFVHAVAGDLNGGVSYPAQAVVKIHGDGTIEGRDLGRSGRFWRKDAILYLLFIREFADSDGDGEGDLRGAIDNIPWLSRLGINAIWLMPVEPSGTTHGYSMDSFFAVNRDYGSIEELREFIAKAQAAGIRVILDKVLNHTSSRHPWFVAAQANEDAVTRDRYLFRPDGSYQYTFNFIGLPDLDYNNPIVRLTAVQRARFWMDLGLDGFRCDIAGFTPMSLWRNIRREMMAKKVDSFMLAEIIPPVADYVEEAFDAFYDPWTYWELRDDFAGNRSFSSVDTALRSAERYLQEQPRDTLRDRLDPADLVRVRYLGNQDEDRFLFLAGGSKERQRVAAAVLMALPGTPLITYGDEVALIESRGRMSFNRDPEMTAHYRRYVRIRRNNPALSRPSSDSPGLPGNTYARISSDNDLNADKVFSFARYDDNQVFVVLANRESASVLGTPATFFLGDTVLERLPDGPIVMTNHANPTDTLQITKGQLRAGATANVGSHEVKIFQLATVQLPDGDADGTLDSYDTCVGVPNGEQIDEDLDGVGNACDHCAGAQWNEDVGMDGCPRTEGAPKPQYDLDGRVDDEEYLVADNDGLRLYASFNGRQLYLAMSGAMAGHDHVLYLRDAGETVPMVAAPRGLPGQSAGRWALVDEGRGDFAQWYGPWVGAPIVSPNPLNPGVVETTVNLVERFGESFPERIGLAVARYDNGGGLSVQAPAPVSADANIDPEEVFELELVFPDIQPATGPTVDAGFPEAPDGGVVTDDADGDTVRDGEDNCPGTKNTDQADLDEDGRGDACDDCPTTPPGARIDGRGCEVGGAEPPPSAFSNDTPGAGGCGCSAAPTSTDEGPPASMALALAVLGLLARRRWRRWAWLPVLLLLGACGAFEGSDGVATGRRLVTGRLQPPDPATFAKQPLALELVAAALDARAADPLIAFVPGTPLSPSANGGEPVTFRLGLPVDTTYVLFFQVPVEGGGGVGRLVAPVRFPDASGALTDLWGRRSPESTVPPVDIDLGVVEISVATGPGSDKVPCGSEGCRTYEVLAGAGGSQNPLSVLDGDGDGVPTLDDSDDDNDLIPDQIDEDADGDNIPDQLQTLDALADFDGNGVPDRFDVLAP